MPLAATRRPRRLLSKFPFLSLHKINAKGLRHLPKPFCCASKSLLFTNGSSFTQGELEGAKPASNWIKCRAKPCFARRAWSEATIFVPQGGTKITALFQAVEKAKGFSDSLKGFGICRSPFAVLFYSSSPLVLTLQQTTGRLPFRQRMASRNGLEAMSFSRVTR